MLQVWKTHKLKVIKSVGDKFIVDAEEHGEIEVLNNDLVLQYKPGEETEVFLFVDQEKNIAGAHGKPLAEPGEFAYLRIVSNSSIGSFFDWGLDKDLFCPFREQKQDMNVNYYYLVYIYIDEETNRAAASSKYEKFLSTEEHDLQEGQKVDAMILNKSQLGYNAVVNNKYQGLLYKNEVFSDLKPGQKLTASIKSVREDYKLDLRMFKNDGSDIANFEELILKYLRENDNKMHINDESEPELIYHTFGISKKNFKKALGGLYKKGLVDLSTNAVKLLNNPQ